MTEPNIKRRRYHAALKAQVLAECGQAGASIARIAMSHGINANLVHKWRRLAQASSIPMASQATDGFIPVRLAPPAPGIGADIRIELRRGPILVTLSWPLAGADHCAHWLREVLR